MATHKQDLSKLSINQLCQLTGRGFRTIKDRLSRIEPVDSDGKSLFYDPQTALPLIYDLGEEGDDPNPLNPTVQQARLSKARADKTELEIQVMKGKLIPAERVEQVWGEMISAFRAKTLSIPTRAAQVIAGMTNKFEVETTLRSMVFESLKELADYAPDQYGSVDSVEGGEDGSAAARSDGESVG